MWQDIVLRFRALFFRRRMDEELKEELDFHIETQARRNRQHDVDPAAAKRQARLQFGSVVKRKNAANKGAYSQWKCS